MPGSRFASGRVSAAPPWRPAHSTSRAVPPAETPGLLAPLVPPRLCARDPTQGEGWAATERRRERRGRRPPRGFDGRGGRSPLSRPESSRRLSKPFGSRSRRLPSALGRSAGPAGQGSAPQRPLSAALGEQRPSPMSGGRGGAGARERGAARRVPGKAGRGPAPRAAIPAPRFVPLLCSCRPRGPLRPPRLEQEAAAAGTARPRGGAPSALGRGRSGPGARRPSARSEPRGALGAGSRRSCPLAASGAPRSGAARAGSAPRCRRAGASCGNEPSCVKRGETDACGARR